MSVSENKADIKIIKKTETDSNSEYSVRLVHFKPCFEAPI